MSVYVRLEKRTEDSLSLSSCALPHSAMLRLCISGNNGIHFLCSFTSNGNSCVYVIPLIDDVTCWGGESPGTSPDHARRMNTTHLVSVAFCL